MLTSTIAARSVNCPDLKTLESLLREELSDPDIGRVEEHIGGCSYCRQILAELVGSLPHEVAPILVPRQQPDEEPPTLPGYTPVCRIDAGGMGVVWRVHDIQFSRPLAIKVMKSKAAGSSVLVERFLAEARVCAQLAHPCIVPIHSMGYLPDGRPYYSMKLVEGRTLAALLVEKHPTEKRMELIRIFGQVCQATAFAHSRGVIHRDLKPANIMVGAHGEVQLMDWGLCKVLDPGIPDPDTEPSVQLPPIHQANLTHAGSILGTVAYMPPEQAQGLVAEIDRRSDVFGLGAILCEILTGQPPYDGCDGEAVREMAANGDLEVTRTRLSCCGADPELIRLAQRCLSSQQANRPQDANEVATCVATYLSGVEEKLRQERLQHERSRVLALEERRRRRLRLAMTTVILITAGLVAGEWMYWQGQHSRLRLEVSQALQQAEQRLRAGDFADAKEWLTRANDRVRDVPIELKGELDRLHSAWRLVWDLREVEQKRTTPTDEGSFDTTGTQECYQRILTNAGYDVIGENPFETARLIRISPVSSVILEAVDNWALVCATEMRFAPTRKVENQRRRDHLLAVARAVDPDPDFRDRLRNPVVWDDLKELQDLAKTANRIDLKPRLAVLLAELLRWKKGNPEPLLRRFQSRFPDDFRLNFDLAKWLDRTNPTEALRYYQAALAIRPHHIVVQSHLGLNARRRLEWDEAITILHGALTRVQESDPLSVSLRNNLAVVMMDKEDIAGAVSLFRQNLKVRPRQVKTHLNIARCLTRMGRLTEALKAYRLARQLAIEDGSPHLAQAQREANEAERRVELERRVSGGRPDTVTAGESLAVAEVYHCKQQYVDAVEFYRRAFTQEPKLADDLDSGFRSSAAFAAALAAEQAERQDSLEISQRVELRKQVLIWLREDLKAWSRRSEDPKVRTAILAELRLWQRHPHLASIRDQTAVSKLSKAEQEMWNKFWLDVKTLHGASCSLVGS